MTHQGAQCRSRFAQVDQDEAPDDGVEAVVQFDTIDIPCDKGDVLVARDPCPHPGDVQRGRINLYPNHRPTRPNTLGQQQGHIAWAAAYIQHLNPCADPGLFQEPPRAGIIQSRLSHEALYLFLGMSKHVGRVGNTLYHSCSPLPAYDDLLR